jgi:hypothetical protein
MERAIAQGIDWLAARIEDGTWKQPSPIGFYFAKLWYFEKLYPIVFTASALQRWERRFNSQTKDVAPAAADVLAHTQPRSSTQL